MFGERMMLILVPEQVVLRVDNGEGRAFALTFDQKLVTQGVGLHTRMGRDPYAEINATLATKAMGEQVLQIRRTIREPNENLPEPAALIAQLEERYADDAARQLVAAALASLWATRPTWNEGQPEWTIEQGTLIARTRCARCHAMLPEGHYKFCSRLCNTTYNGWLSDMRRADECNVMRIAGRMG